MHGNKLKRLVELERQLAASHEQATDKRIAAIWEQLSEEEQSAMFATLDRREQPGYVFTAEDEAIEQCWLEAVQVVVPEDQWVS
jgi:hypothetical protein